ncbi:uncharacterized protein LOC109716528 isoform X2 [Ananas comosus]|nr:uncharacterized protein LOC109716528 isoform X2 [Ananas comosus]
METRTLIDMALVPGVETIGAVMDSSDKTKVGAPPLKPRKKSMTSLYLKYFETASDGKSRRCKFCKQSYSIATATGNLGRHLNNRHPGYDKYIDSAQQTPQASAATANIKPQVHTRPGINLDHLNWLLLKWLIGASLPAFTLGDEMLLNSFKFLNPSIKIWPREKVQAVSLEVFRSMREDVRTSLEQVNSRVSITVDFWTSYEQIFYMSVKCHWIDESWSMHKVLLDVCHISYPCSGPEILHALMKALLAFNIDSKILSCTNDNSQQAIHACHALKEELDARKIPFCYIPCAATTLKLIIQDGLITIKPILSKIREFVLEMNSYPEIIEDFKQLAVLYQEVHWKFPLDTSSSWNGDYTMLDLIRKAPNAMDGIIKKHEETFGGRNLLLSTTEKSVVTILHSYLEPFYKTTTNLCTCKVHTVGLVLFLMDHVFDLISSCRESCRQEWLKRVADDMSKRARSFTTQAYYPFTFTAAVLDPRIKRDLIPEALNSEKHLEEASSHFLRDYSSTEYASMSNGFATQDSTTENSDIVSFAEEIARKRRRVSTTNSSDELSQYLAEPPAPIATDVLDWWKVNSTRYPRLSVMARDYLAIQGTSVEPDELFTGKGDSINKQKYCLPFSSMQAALCINSWIQSGYRFKFRSTEIDFDKLVEAGASASVDNVKL